MAGNGCKQIEHQLDEMALKILMVEPGDLSFVGDLVMLVESLKELPEIEDYPVIKKMGETLEDILGKIVMAELDDSAENFELLGKAISQMQEIMRKGGLNPEAEKSFADFVRKMGYGDQGATQVEPEKEPQSQEEIYSPPVIGGPPSSFPAIDKPPDDALDFLQDMELLAGFVEETLEHLESIEVNVLELEDHPGDLEIVNRIFRPFHTIKGVSGFLNLKHVQKLAHTTENLLDDVRNGVRGMDTNVIDVVLKVGDFLRMMVENLKVVLDGGPEKYVHYDITGYVDWVVEVQTGTAVASTPAAPVQEEPPAIQETESVTVEQKDSVPEMPSAPVQTAVAPQPVKAQESGASVDRMKAPAAQKKKVGASIKVDVEKLDGLVNAVGELVIMQAMVRANPLVAGIADTKLAKDFSQLSRITTELQKTAMSMRMVPIRQTFQKMIRLVRDLSRKTGKEVNLFMEGEETEIDRNMVDSIYDPLVHMMRNSVDHGVQVPDERVALGKPRDGNVFLRAFQKGGNIVIEIEDDGHGLSTDKIRQKAIERKLIQANDNLSDYELNNMIFMPGFSTADKITDVSGRGVGMDVVKKAVEKLRGKVEVNSEPGKGSLFTIRLPLTLAIIDGIIVRVGEERYIIPTTAIQESLNPKIENYNTIHGKGETLMVRNTLVPILRLYELFNIEPEHTDPCKAIVVVVEAEGKLRAIMVDELLGKQEVVIKNLGGLNDIRGVAGGTILGDGRVGLILDLAGLVTSRLEHEAGLSSALEETEEGA